MQDLKLIELLKYSVFEYQNKNNRITCVLCYQINPHQIKVENTQ